MKYLFLILISVVTLNVNAHTTNFLDVSPTSAEGLKLEEIKLHAIQLLLEAEPHLREELKPLVPRAIRALELTYFKAADNEQSVSFCINTMNNASFFVDSVYPYKIFICRHPWISLKTIKNINKDMFSQFIIHEAAHIIFIYDECKATEFEYEVMKNTRAGVKNTINYDGYLKNCDILKKLDFSS